MLFIGHTRFSLFNPSSSSWKATNGRFSSVEDYEAYLYSDSRMAARCEIFIEHSLPQLEAASVGHDVFHVVSYSANLPQKYQNRLEWAAKRFPFLVLDRHEAGRSPLILDDLARSFFDYRPDDTRVFGTYRLDDDDLLSIDFFDQMSQHMNLQNVGMQVSLAAGFTALYEGGKYSNFRETHWPMLAIGLLSICRIDENGRLLKPVHAPHHISDRSNAVILDSRRPSYLWVRHVDQDTAMDFDRDRARNNVLSQMSKYPIIGIDVNVRRLFPSLANAVKVRSSKILLDQATAIRGVLEFPFGLGLNDFQLVVDAGYSDGVVPGNALFSLNLTNADGRPLGLEQMSALAASGVATSANSDVGFYRYLDTDAGGRKVSTYAFVLPTDVVCHGVGIRHWKRAETQITLHSMALETEV